MLTVIGAAISLLSGIIALWAWYLKRKRAPTIEERKEDVRQQFQDALENVYRLREQGKHDEADAMLNRLSHAAVLRIPPKPAKPDGDSNGERLGDNSSEGKPSAPADGS